MTPRRLLLLALVAAFVTWAPKAAPIVSAQGGQSTGLFTPVQTLTTAAADRATVRSEQVRVNFNQLVSAAGHKPVAMELLGVQTTTILTPTQEFGGFTTFVGRTPESSEDNVILTAGQGTLAGSIELRGRTMQVQAGANGLATIREINESALAPNENAPVASATTIVTETNSVTTQSTDDGSIIDILYLYTPAARDAAGGDAQIRARIVSDVELMNNSYVWSQIYGVRFRLRDIVFVNYTEADPNHVPPGYKLAIHADLDRLRQSKDVGAMRNRTGADLVAMMEGTSPYLEACGVAYQFGPDAVGHPERFSEWAFSISKVGCGNLTTAHEAGGHNVGMEHDRINTPTPNDGAFPAFAYGWMASDYKYSCIMAYQANGSERIHHYSNPNVVYDGYVTGASDQNNAEVARRTHYDVARFRSEQGASGSIGIDTPSGAMTFIGQPPATIHVAGRASANIPLTRVDVSIDYGAPVQATLDSSTGQWSFEWDTTQLTSGRHAITAVLNGDLAQTTTFVDVTIRPPTGTITIDHPTEFKGDTRPDTLLIDGDWSLESPLTYQSVTVQVDSGAIFQATQGAGTRWYLNWPVPADFQTGVDHAVHVWLNGNLTEATRSFRYEVYDAQIDVTVDVTVAELDHKHTSPLDPSGILVYGASTHTCTTNTVGRCFFKTQALAQIVTALSSTKSGGDIVCFNTSSSVTPQSGKNTTVTIHAKCARVKPSSYLPVAAAYHS